MKPEYLLGFFRKYNNAQAQKLVETYIGKWVKLSGIVGNVYSYKTSGEAFVTITTNTSTTGATFDEQRWVARALVLTPGERITVFGRITKIDSVGFLLDKCEVVE